MKEARRGADRLSHIREECDNVVLDLILNSEDALRIKGSLGLNLIKCAAGGSPFFNHRLKGCYLNLKPDLEASLI